MVLRNCHNFHDFRRLAKRRLPGPIFDYIDGAADEETTHRRNTKAFESCDLVPSVWVRLAQRIPVRIHIDDVPKGALVSFRPAAFGLLTD